MDYSRKQKQLDVKKWLDSETNGYDACGSYSYCSSCNKDAAYPCAYAYDKYATIAKLAKETTVTEVKKAPAKKAKVAAASTTTAKKAPAKKAACKKTTSKVAAAC